MKSIRKLLFANLLVASSVFLLVCKAQSELEVSATVQIHAVGDFSEPLAAEGAWIEVAGHGRCWHPRGIAADWRPYCEGTWVWTDCGWYWDTDEPWGWACYHYGRWVDDPASGWVWLPDVEWAPAWVQWRVGGGYIGWAPCGPAGVIVEPTLFGFVEVGHFGDPIRRSVVVVNSTTIIQKTSRAPDFKRETRNIGGKSQTVVVNNGPGVDPIEKATGKKLSTVPVRQAVERSPAPRRIRSVEQPNNPPAANRIPQTQERNDRPVDRPTQTTRPVEPSSQHNERPATTPGEARPAAPSKEERPAMHSTPPREEKPASPPKEEKPTDPTREKGRDSGARDNGNMRMLAACGIRNFSELTIAQPGF